jgi:glutathione S-transferase
MIQLFHCMSARSFRPLWTLEELELPYSLVMLPFPPRLHARSFLEINPLGTVPALVNGKVRMTESVAMCQYLADHQGDQRLTVDPLSPDYAPYLDGLHFGEATLTFPQTLVLRYSRFEPDERRQPQVVDDYTRWFLARLRRLSARVANGRYWCGDRFTLADISVGYALMLSELLGMRESWPDHVSDYWATLVGRPGYARAMAAQFRAATEQNISTRPATECGAVPTAGGS